MADWLFEWLEVGLLFVFISFYFLRKLGSLFQLSSVNLLCCQPIVWQPGSYNIYPYPHFTLTLGIYITPATQKSSYSLSHYAAPWLICDWTMTVLSSLLTAGSTVSTLPLAAQSKCPCCQQLMVTTQPLFSVQSPCGYIAL